MQQHEIRTGFCEPPVSSSSSSSAEDDYSYQHDSEHENNESKTKASSHHSTTAGRPCDPGRSRGRRVLPALGTAVRWIVLDAPYFILALLLCLSNVAIYYHDEYIVPQLTLLQWNQDRATREVTYYKRLCTAADQSTHDPHDLVLHDQDMTDDDMVDKMLQHGVVVLPDLLPLETARLLRETIIKYNTVEENFGVISNKHRYSYGIRMEQDPIVRTAVKEIATHPLLQKLLPKLIDHDPALYKFHAITSTYGAADQHYHWDVKASESAVAYSRSFAPLYSLFIPLQDTPVAMGPTQICPGSHVCSAGTNFCHQTAFQILLKNRTDSSSSSNTNATTTTTTDNDDAEPVWPATYGALMNQQTTHRGRAHVLENGMDRVLFILAITPRPRSNVHISQLETRSLSLGGSYAIHWTQWGHTWSDLYRETMYNPIKTLRSLGLYKPHNTFWGREWLMTALLQLANGDYWDRSNLMSHLKKGGLWYIPKIFHHDLPAKYASDEDEDLVWYHFYYRTFRNVVRWLPVVVLVALGLYTILYTWVQLAVAAWRRHGLAPVASSVRAYAGRLIVLHTAAWGIAVLVRHRLDARPWSRHLQQRKMYTLPTTFAAQPHRPSTLPVPHDVLMLDDFQSDYLASYTRLYDVGHPGNAQWKRRLAATVHDDYPNWPPPVRAALQESLVRQVETEALGRFLTKNSHNQWARMTRPTAKAFVHSELLRSARPHCDVLLREMAYRLSETKFGPWRDTAMHRSHIPRLLATLEGRLVGTATKAALPPSSLLSRTARSSSPAFSVRQRSPVRVIVLPQGDGSARMVNPSVGDHEDDNDDETPRGDGPYHGAWLQVGDRVDALHSESETYWYPGTIIEATAHSNKWVVAFDNYEEPKIVCRQCVLPLKPLEVDDTVEMSYKTKFFPGQVHAVYGDSFDFVFADTPGKVFADVPLRKYRRPLPDFGDPEQIEYDLGEPVFALYFDKDGKSDGTFFAATVVAIEHPDKDLYTLYYADNDEVSGMHARDLRPMTYLLEHS